jgi:hypothetical protein
MGAAIGAATESRGETLEWLVVVLKKINQHIFWAVRALTDPADERFARRFTLQGRVYSVYASHIRIISTGRCVRKIGLVSHKDFQPIWKLYRLVRTLH